MISQSSCRTKQPTGWGGGRREPGEEKSNAALKQLRETGRGPVGESYREKFNCSIQERPLKNSCPDMGWVAGQGTDLDHLLGVLEMRCRTVWGGWSRGLRLLPALSPQKETSGHAPGPLGGSLPAISLPATRGRGCSGRSLINEVFRATA